MKKATSSKIIYEGFFDLKEEKIEIVKGKTETYCYLASKGDGVVILAEPSPSTFIFIHEYRIPIQKKILSCPGGRLEQGESLLDGANRELLEETGYRANSMKLLYYYFPFPSASDQKNWVFHATGLSLVAPLSLDPIEDISVKILSLSEIYDLDLNKYELDSTIPSALFFKSLFKE